MLVVTESTPLAALFLGFQNCGLTSVSPCQVRKVLSEFYVFIARCHELCLVRLLTQKFLCLHHDRASVRSRPLHVHRKPAKTLTPNRLFLPVRMFMEHSGSLVMIWYGKS